MGVLQNGFGLRNMGAANTTTVLHQSPYYSFVGIKYKYVTMFSSLSLIKCGTYYLFLDINNLVDVVLKPALGCCFWHCWG